MSKTVGFLIGSLRKGSFSRQIADAVASRLPEGYEAKFIEIGQLPLYNQDYDADTPEAYGPFRDEVKALDALVFVTPEHNRSFPAALKNALDVGSRPYGQSVWNAKPGAVISVSPGAISGFGANHQLRQVLSFLNIYMLSQPETYIGNVTKVLDNDGNVTDEGTDGFLKSFVDAYIDWIEKF